MKMADNHGIIIKFVDMHKPPLLKDPGIYRAEDLCIDAARHCGIGPSARHLFALKKTSSQNVKNHNWLSPNEEFIVGTNESLELQLRLRFHPVISKLQMCDTKAFDYYFLQVRRDFVDGNIEEAKKKEDALGLAVTDMLRVKKESCLTLEAIKKDFKNYLPLDVYKKHNYGGLLAPFIKKTIHDYLLKLDPDFTDVSFIKGQYIQGIRDISPSYVCEEYEATMMDGMKEQEVKLQIDPYHPEEPGLRILRPSNKKDVWTSLCAIDELCFISKNKNGEELEISRRNGIPQYLRFKGDNAISVFVSALDGYYRLMEKWTFNLCREMPTPSLIDLRRKKCHGPIGRTFAYNKLLEKRNNKCGSYLLREGKDYDTYKLDICIGIEDEAVPHTSTIRCNVAKTEFRLENVEDVFETISDILTYNQKKYKIEVLDCVPPYEDDKSNLLLCRQEKKDAILPTTSKSRSVPVCIQPADIYFDPNGHHYGQSSIVCKGVWHKDLQNKMAVAVKMSRDNSWDLHIKEFLESANRCLVWHCESIVCSYGVILSNPLALVMQYMPLGPLDVYLRDKRNSVQVVDLVEASLQLANALWYLEENKMVHGNIRCHNVLLAAHEQRSFQVKLGDPSVGNNSLTQVHWIPPECYDNFSQARHSLAADIWAFGTTLWEIFAYGESPSLGDLPQNTLVMYKRGAKLPRPETCGANVYNTIMKKCWLRDPDSRMKPQAIMRDMHQIFHQEYPFCRDHPYHEIVHDQQDEDSDNDDDDYDNENNPDKINDPLWIIKMKYLELKGVIGQGCYGKVHRGILRSHGTKPEIVAVKQLKIGDTGNNESKELMREINIMKSLVHKNIVQIKGIVKEPEKLLVMEFVPLGSLWSYLRMHKQALTEKCLLKFAMDVAEGMEYLGQKGVVHRDLAARNILVETASSVKISDFGLAQKTGPKDYYRLKTERNLPIRWYAPETIRHWKFTHKSDVWSFGVTLWEMFSFGEDPIIPDCPDNKDVLLALESEKRLRCPETCSLRIYTHLMIHCWAAVDIDRPDFTKLLVEIRDLHENA